MLFASSFVPPPPQLRGLLLLNSQLSTRNSQLATLNSQLSRNSCSLAQLLLSCFIGSASARAAQIPSICPPRHLLSSQPQLRLGMSSPVTAARLRSCLPPSANAARPTRRPPRRARCRSPCRSPPAGYSRGNQTQNPAGKTIKKVVVIQQRGAAGSGGSWVASPICPRIRPFFRARSGRRPFRAFSISAHFFARKIFAGRNWNWCPSVMPLPRRCAACVVAGAPPAAASAPTGLVVRG